jgi:hypothetical protein
MGITTGSDVHDPSKVDVFAWTTLVADNITEEAVWNELIHKRTSFIYNGLG